jgi:hypothetical protein
MFGEVLPPPRTIKEIKTPENMVQELLVGGEDKDFFSARHAQALVGESKLVRRKGQTLYYPLRLSDFPEGVGKEERHVQEILMRSYERLQAAVSDVLVGLGCNLYCTTDPTFEREDLLGTGYSRLRGRSNLLLKEGNPDNSIPYDELVFESCQHSTYERVIRCLGADGKMKFLKIVENLAGCERVGQTNNYTFHQNMQAIVDTMRKTAIDHASGNVHRDIKPEHLLIVPTTSRKNGVRGKRCDQESIKMIGMLQPEPDSNKIILSGTPNYSDIKYFDYNEHDLRMNRPPIDVFSYGITLLAFYLGKHYDKFMIYFHKKIETEEGEFPKYHLYIADIRKEDILKAVKKAGAELDIPDRIFELIISMLRRDRNIRPRLKKVIQILEEEFDLEESLNSKTSLT